MNTIYLDPKMVPAVLRGAYNGQKFKAVVCETVDIPSDAGLWSGGSRELYSVVTLDDGMKLLPGQDAAPWNRNYHNRREIMLQPGVVVVRHSIFCGKDTGLTFYVHPENATKLLPAPAAELSEHERMVLEATCSLKSHYNGRDRYQMATDSLRYNRKPYPSRDEWNAAKQSLIDKGLLNKAGAVTVAGRNARPSRY